MKYSRVVKVDGKRFRYNYDNSCVEYLWGLSKIDKELAEQFGEVVDSIGLSSRNWKNAETREEYLDEYIARLDEEARYLTQ